ncbi:hypothetical protein BKA69DRAFT_29579 [Paraphysoderma sedebokerense]|nr:hypothetical protein BKA69DRAFT_29579 [Paraphysoderma sedebokerense]
MRTRRKRTDIDYSDYADLSDPGDSPSLASDITDASEQSSRSSRYSKRLRLADDNAESDQEVDDSRPGTPVKIVIEDEMEPLPEDEDERYLRTTSKIAYISYFCDIFRFLLELQRFTAEEVEKELLRVEESILIADIFIKLLDQFPKNKIVRYVSLSNWEDVLRYHCSRRNIDLFPPEMRYFDLDIQAKVELIVMVCDWVFEYKSDYIFELNMDPNILRVVPLGQDNEDTNYWYFNDTRLYIERTMVPPNDEVTSQESEWRLLCSTSSEWKQILERLETSRHKSDKKLLKNFLPVAEDVISKLERVEKDLAKKEYFALLPKKRSSRIAEKEEERRHEELRRREEEVAAIKLAEERKKEEEERRRQELEERRQRLHEPRGSVWRKKRKKLEKRNASLIMN